MMVVRERWETAVMNAVTSAKSSTLNTIEGIALTALLIFFPIFTCSYLLLKLFGTHQIVGDALLLVPLTSLAAALFQRWLGPKYAAGYVPSFFDASLSLAGKIAAWYERPVTAYKLLTLVFILSLLGLLVLSTG
jgi:hypothetical protein